MLLVEAEESFRKGCNTAMSTSMVPAGGSRWQAGAGIDDSPEAFLADVVAKTRAAPTRPWRARWLTSPRGWSRGWPTSAECRSAW